MYKLWIIEFKLAFGEHGWVALISPSVLDNVKNGLISAIIALNSLFRLGFAIWPDCLSICWPFTLSTTALPLYSVGGSISPNAAAGSTRAVVAEDEFGENRLTV